MPNTTELVDTISARVRENLKKGEQGTLKAVEAWTAAVEGILPEQLVALESKLPRPAEVVALTFEVADRALGFQVDMLKSIAGVIDPVVGNLVPANGTAAGNGTKAAPRTTKTASK